MVFADVRRSMDTTARWKRIRATVDELDQAVFDAIADTDSPWLDSAMPRLTRAADHSKLWLGIAGALALTPRRRAHRAALRGVTTVAVTSLVTNAIAKRISPRDRPDTSIFPVTRLARRMPTSSSFPSGHAASAAAFSTAVGLELPGLAIPLNGLAGAVGFSRVATGAHYPSDVLGGWLLGSTIAYLGAKIVPPAAAPAKPERRPATLHLPPRPDGNGVRLVVNPASHSGQGAKVLRWVTWAMPKVEVVELSPDDDIAAVMARAAADCEVLGVAGGDGTVGAAAVAAMEAGVPLAVFPAGTFNHFAKDIPAFPLELAIQAVRKGDAARVDVAYLNDQLFLNTASFGAYTEFVTIREKYEHRVGKPAAALYAAVRTMRNNKAIRLRVDDRTSLVNLAFIGNGSYQPSGFAPSFREDMDDGLLDCRMLDTSGPAARLAVLVAIATGTLKRSSLYHQIAAPDLIIDLLDGPVQVARDGELGEWTDQLRLRVARRALTVYRY